jgi:hypothetical protein
LRELNLDGVSIDETAMAALADLPHLEKLDLAGSLLWGEAAGRLKDLKGLRELDLGGTNISDAGMASVGQLRELRKLDVSNACVTDVGMKQLWKLEHLQELDLHLTFVTDKGLVGLEKLPELRKLSLSKTEVEAEGLRHLAAANPALVIETDDWAAPRSALAWYRGFLDAMLRRAAAGEGNPAGIEKLTLLNNAPVMPKCKLDPLLDEHQRRRYVACDLRGDGTKEYFVENFSGAHSMSFALVDKKGTPLIGAKDIPDFGGDGFFVLRSTHHGYSDVVCWSEDAGGAEGALWRFDGKQYSRAGSFSLEDELRIKASLQSIPGALRAMYCELPMGVP